MARTYLFMVWIGRKVESIPFPHLGWEEYGAHYGSAPGGVLSADGAPHAGSPSPAGGSVSIVLKYIHSKLPY